MRLTRRSWLRSRCSLSTRSTLTLSMRTRYPELASGRGTLETLSGNGYHTVILPRPTLLSQKAVDRLRAFALSGGHVLFLGGKPSLIFDKAILKARAAAPADFSSASVEDSTQLPSTPTPPHYPPPAPPSPQVVPPTVLAAVNAAVPAYDLSLDTRDTALRYTRRRLKDADVYLFF